MRCAQWRINRVGLAVLKIEICHITVNLIDDSRESSVSIDAESKRLKAGRSRKDYVVFAAINAMWRLTGVVLIRIATALRQCENTRHNEQHQQNLIMTKAC